MKYKDKIIIYIYSIMTAKELSDDGYTLFNVDSKKLPVYNGFGIKGWNNMSHNDLKKRINFSKEMFGMRMGKQGNGKHILSLDFDCCKKVKGSASYIPCEETADLFTSYIWATAEAEGHAGIFDSSTDGNNNVLIDYSNCPKLITLLKELDTAKINYLGLEILIGGHQVIPPTMTTCKYAGKCLRGRKFWTDKPFYVIPDENDKVCGYINKMISKSFIETNKNIVCNKDEKKRKYQKVEHTKETKNEETKTEEKNTELLDMIDIKDWNKFNDWKKIMWAMKSEGYARAVAEKYSMKSYKFSVEGFNNVWDKSPSNINITQGTINHYARKGDESKYYEYMNKQNDSGDVVMDMNKFYGLVSELEMSDELKKEMEMYDKLNKQEQVIIDKKVKEFDDECFQDELKKKLEYFEAFHFKVMNPACFGRTAYNKTLLVNASELELQYENVCVGENNMKWTKIWRSLKYIRTFENVDFLPSPLPCPKYTLNTFNGLRAEKLPSCEVKDIDLLLNHIKILSGNDDAGTKYIIDYLAHSVQKPGELPRVALVFQSDQGTGKNIFFENFVRKLLGGEYLLQTAEMDKVIGRFSMINNKLFVIMDETSGKDSFSNSDKIKNIITAEQVAWERKGIDGININNCGRYLFFSNNETPVKIESSDRRYVVYKCSNDRQNDSVYFKEMSKMFNDDAVIKTFYNYLMNEVDISNWDSINDRPITEAYQDIQSANTPAMAKWLEERYFEMNHLIEMESDEEVLQEHKVIPSKTLYTLYVAWLSENGFRKMEYNTTKFGRELGKYDGISKKRNKSGMVYVIDYEVLKTFMIRKKYMECIVSE